MTTTTTNPEYRAQTDAATAAWHLGRSGKANVCVCGCKLMTPDDTRAFALKVPVEKRGYQTDPDVAKVTCGSCKRNGEYAKATAGDPGPQSRTVGEAEAGHQVTKATEATAADQQLIKPGQAARPSRRRARTGDPSADRATAGAGR